MIFDSHAHYNDKRFDDNRDDIIAEVFNSGIGRIMNVGTNVGTSLESIELAEKYENIYASVGVHPHDTEKIEDEKQTIDEIYKLLHHKKVMALGEIGLDFYYDFSARDIQVKWFDIQMQIAADTGYPVIIHDREAHGACVDTVSKYPNVTGIFHSYSGSAEMAAELIKRGWYISFSGVITFKNAAKILEVVKTIPLDRLLIETDCPFLAPHPMRGKLNHSGYMIYTAEKAAELCGISYDEMCKITYDNACAVYKIG
jgi:hydrolase, TatD family